MSKLIAIEYDDCLYAVNVDAGQSVEDVARDFVVSKLEVIYTVKIDGKEYSFELDPWWKLNPVNEEVGNE